MRRVDPVTGLVLVLEGEGNLHVRSPRGEPVRDIAPPPGFAFSHFAGPGAVLVCRGEREVEGWRDWQFEVDAAAGTLRRVAPAW
jgi:hypothetical protein